ncbi:MAG: class I SAM-dependent methyltransferase [Caulobacterales bacterium]|nr:class I SAM-dependent methyltransferase [Caulobacterales bacterium]
MLTIEPALLEARPGEMALDLGCGGGRHAHALARMPDLLVVAADLDAEAVADTRAGFAMDAALTGWSLAQVDAARLPFGDARLDRVVCSEVLEHLPDYRSALDEIARVCRVGGRFALSVPRGWPEAICWALSEGYRTTPGGHVRIFSARRLRREVEARGFRFRARRWAHGLHSPYWWLKCLLWRRRDDHPLIRAYQRFLEWDILKRPVLTRALAGLADPVMGKSGAMYFDRVEAAA